MPREARPYVAASKLPSELKQPRDWRTRPDPFEEHWPEIEARLQATPELEAKTLFELLQQQYPGRYKDGQLRTLHRHVKRWHGPRAGSRGRAGAAAPAGRGGAQHIRNVPGRKTDVNDATWISELLAHGLIRSSFVPPAPIQELRDLTRTRKQLVREMSQHTLRIQKVLEDANLKLDSVLSSVVGKSGRAMLKALIDGETDPERLADLALGTAKKKRAALIEALRGRVTTHHRSMLKLHMQMIDAIESALREVDAHVGKALAPIQACVQLLTTIPGVSDIVANVIVAEIGTDMTRFPSPGHLISWAGLCPAQRRERWQAALDANA